MMRNRLLVTSYSLLVTVLLSGCVVRTYQATKDRVDQDLNEGNRGYIMGSSPVEETKERKTTRTTRVIEIEMRSPLKFEKMPKAKPVDTKVTADMEIKDESLDIMPEASEAKSVSAPSFEKYTVQKEDTLQKISKKFYGTTKKWMKIYEANKGTLKGTDKIYPGQVIDIPLERGIEPVKEPSEKMK